MEQSQQGHGKDYQSVKDSQVHKGNFDSKAEQNQSQDSGNYRNYKSAPTEELIEIVLQKRTESGRLSEKREYCQNLENHQNYSDGGLEALILQVDFHCAPAISSHFKMIIAILPTELTSPLIKPIALDKRIGGCYI